MAIDEMDYDHEPSALSRIAAALEAIAERQPVWQFWHATDRYLQRGCVHCGSTQFYRSGMWNTFSGPGCPRCKGVES